MLLFHHKVISTVISGTTPVYSSPDLYRELAQADQMVFQFRGSNFNALGTSTIEVQYSSDGSQFQTSLAKNFGMPANATTFSAENAAFTVYGPFCRIAVYTAVGITGYLELWVAGRARRSTVSMLEAYRQAPVSMAAEAGGALDEASVEWLAAPRGPMDWSSDGMRPASRITPHGARTTAGEAFRRRPASRPEVSTLGTAPLGTFRGGDAAADDLRERARLLDTVRIIDQLNELGTLDPGQLRDLNQWLGQGGGPGIERNAFWQGVLGNPFDPFGDLGIADQQRGLDAVRARNQRPGYDWQDEGRARGDEARAGLGLGRFGLASDAGAVVPGSTEPGRIIALGPAKDPIFFLVPTTPTPTSPSHRQEAPPGVGSTEPVEDPEEVARGEEEGRREDDRLTAEAIRLRDYEEPSPMPGYRAFRDPATGVPLYVADRLVPFPPPPRRGDAGRDVDPDNAPMGPLARELLGRIWVWSPPPLSQPPARVRPSQDAPPRLRAPAFSQRDPSLVDVNRRPRLGATEAARGWEAAIARIGSTVDPRTPR